MPKRSTLLALLKANDEPSQKSYSEAINNTTHHPEQIGKLTEDSIRDDVLILLTTNSHRLHQFFDGLHRSVRNDPGSWTASNLATETANFIVALLPHLDQLLEPSKTLEFLVPTLELCLVPSRPLPPRKLPSALADSGRLLQYLTTDYRGCRLSRQLICAMGTSDLDIPILQKWTEILADMVSTCDSNHDVAQTIQRSHALKHLNGRLRSLEAEHLRQLSIETPGHDLPSLSNMTQLKSEDKKARAGGKETETCRPTLDESTKNHLREFGLPDPASWATLQHTIEKLQGTETSKLLLSVMEHFPCQICIQCLGSSPRTSDPIGSGESHGNASNMDLEILGSNLGVWQILLSPQSRTSLQEMSGQGTPARSNIRLAKLIGSGLIHPVAEKLKDLASGCWSTRISGNEAQRKGLKVPLFETKCGKDKIILWQVDLGFAQDSQMVEQLIKVWGVGSLPEVCEVQSRNGRKCAYTSPYPANASQMTNTFNRVASLQQSYCSEHVRRCRQRPFLQDKSLLPARFEDSMTISIDRPVSKVDVKVIDQATIDMANKFYALTEPTFRAILANDLSAEFLLHLSNEEKRIISHTQTASLTLGRSGTGKTTCLIYKLVAKYLTSKSVVGETPVKQVLLTRSSYLADKLKAHVQGLIRTLEPKMTDASYHIDSRKSALAMPQNDIEGQSVANLREHSFPLVLTFDDFLRLLQSVAEDFERRSIGKAETSQSHILSQAGEDQGLWQEQQIVDLHTFKLDYWLRFPRSLTRNFDASLVFADIMGVIKGSSSSGKSLAPLSRQQYLDRSCRLAPVFIKEDDRSLVYDIFERYEEMKLERHSFDDVDRVIRLISMIRGDMSLKQLLESTFQEVYIDEVQDHRLVDVQLFLEFIKDNRGFHFAGDTAQAISQDSSFRFSDVKALFYENFAAISAYTNQPHLAHAKMLTLSKNYRSHQGILALASFIMGLIWKSFPETVDKLEPEIGEHNGLRPVFFVGCDSHIFRTTNVALVKLSDGEYGADQVILVRDQRMKLELQDQIGNIALILTIQDSKGMEFTDVLLWDFFTSSPDPAGVRSLRALTTDTGSGFAYKHSAMRLELKLLYVAVTRARSQLFVIESSEKAVSSVVELLKCNSSEPLVDITRPTEMGFSEKVKLLRPGKSIDPRRWSLRGDELMQRQNHVDALMCYKKAGNQRGETIATAKMFEDKGRASQSQNDLIGFAQNLETAITLFLETNMIGDAAKNLVNLRKYKDAAELWLDHSDPGKAAPLFAKAGLLVESSDCYLALDRYDEAAAMLRQGKHYDQLVIFLDRYSDDLSANALQSFRVLTKLLLKQEKLSIQCRKYGVRLLGSSREQEECYREYGMDDDLAELYATQSRHEDLYRLFTRKGELERALKAAITGNLLQSKADDLRTQILSLMDYVCAGYLERNQKQLSTAPLELPPGFLTPQVSHRFQEWQSCDSINGLEGSVIYQHVTGMSDSLPKTFLCLRKTLGKAIDQAANFDDLPFELVQEATRFMRALIFDKSDDAMKIVLLLTGIWKPKNGKARYTVLPWSPIRKEVTGVKNDDLENRVKQTVYDRLVSVILELNERARTLLKMKWPTRCVQFMALGFCPRKRNGEECLEKHDFIYVDDCTRLLDDLIQINRTFCDLAAVYYGRILNESFQKMYLSIRRHWLEQLLRHVTFLSSVEQNAAAILKTQERLLHEQRLLSVSCFIEELLYFRLRNEWQQRNSFTSLLEQMQLAKKFGFRVQNRIFRALSHRLLNDGRHLLQGHLLLSTSLIENLGMWKPLHFQENLTTFLLNLENIDVSALSTLHSLATMFEYLATYFLLKTCNTACILPKSWIDLHVTPMSKTRNFSERPKGDDKHSFHSCLIQLAKGYCRILSRSEQAALPPDFLLCNGRPHKSLLLRQRNAELVAIIVANLAVVSPEPPAGFNEIWAKAKEVIEYEFIKAFHLRSLTPNDLIQNLRTSFARYQGKDALVVVAENRKKPSPFFNLERYPDVKTVAFSQLCPPPAPAAVLTHIPTNYDTSPAPPESPHDQYNPTEIEAMIKIQRLWRSVSDKIRTRRSYASVPVFRATTHFFNLGTHCPDTVAGPDQKPIRRILVLRGVALSLRLDVAKGSLSQLQEDVMRCIEEVDLGKGVDESVDEILCRNRDVEAMLGRAVELLDDKSVLEIVRMGDVAALEGLMDAVERGVREAEGCLGESRKMVEGVEGK